MPTVNKAASTNTAVTTGWTNPTNAYASDNVYATATPATNATVDSDFGYSNFTTGEVPNGAYINSITSTMECIAASSVPVTITLLKSGTQTGTSATSSSTTEGLFTTGAGTATLTDLRNASTVLKSRVGGTRSGTSATVSLDYVYLTVDYTAANANLSALSISGATLSPTFASGTTSYTTSVLYANSTPTLTATAEVPNSSIQWRLNNATYSSASTGTLTATLSTLNVGSNTLDILVTDGNSLTKTYTVTITRGAASTNADLSAMAFSGVTLSPSFSASTITYTGVVTYEVLSTTLTATRSSTVASALEYRLNSGSWTSFAGTGSATLALAAWANTIEVRVTAESGATKTYTTTITRVGAFDFQTNLTINGLAIAPSFASNLKWGNF